MSVSNRSARRLVVKRMRTLCSAALREMKFWMPRASPKSLSTCGERLFEISRSERIASSMT